MVAIRQQDDALWLTLSDLDLDDGQGLEALCSQLPTSCRRVIFDLGAIERLQATGLGRLLTLRRQLLARGCTDFTIARPSAQINELSQLLGLRRVFAMAA